MPTTKTPVTVAPMPTDHRVVMLSRSLGLTVRAAWAMAAEAWAWLQAEAGEDGVVPGAAALLDAVADVEGLGAALVATGLVGETEQGIVLPAELVRASRLLDGGGDAVAEDRKRKAARERKARSRKRHRLTQGATKRTATSAPGPGQQTEPRRRPRKLGVACGHAVMLLDGPFGLYVTLENAKPKCSASAESHGSGYEGLTLADALELLLPMHESHKAERAGYRVPKLSDLEDATRLERHRQQTVDAEAARYDQGNAVLLEAAAEAEDDVRERDRHASVTPVTRDARDGHASCHASAESESAASPSGDEELGADPCHAICHASGPAEALSSSSSLRSSPAQQRTTTTTTGQMDSSRPFERDSVGDGPEAMPEWMRKDRQARNQVKLERWAAALGKSQEEVVAMYREDKEALRERLEAAGVNPDTGFPLPGRITQGRASSAALVNGIRLPDLGVDRLRAVVHEDETAHEDDNVLTTDLKTMPDDAPGGQADVA